MSLLRRSVAKAVPVANALVPYPLGRYPCSLPKLDTDLSDYIDRRPISIRYRVTAMIEMSNLDEAWRISRLAVLDKYRVDRDTVFICNSVIGAMCSAKRYDEAMSVFNYFFNEYKTLPNMLSLNLIIKAHCDQGRVDDALHLYRHILSLSPSMETYRILTKALVDARRLDEACDLVASMSRCDFVVYNSLIRGFLDIGKYVRANQLFEQLKGKLPWRDYHKAIAIFNVSFMNYWFKQGKDEEAMEIFATLEQAELLNTIAGNWVLEVLVEHGKTTEAWELFREMIEISDSETVDIIMSKDFSQKLTLPLMDRVRSRCYPTMIPRFCELGFMSEAEELFAEMFSGEDFLPGPDVSTFRAMINGYVKVGRVDDAIKTLNKLKISNLRKFAIHRAT